MPYEPVVEALVEKINSTPEWLDKFTEAVESARSTGIQEMEPIKTLQNYFHFLNDLLLWVPSENFQGTDVYNHFCLFYFVLDQPSTKDLQTPILPGPNPESLT